MKKNIILLIFFALSSNLLQAQEWVELIPWECSTPQEDPAMLQPGPVYVYDPDGPVKTMRVNLYFLLRTDGTGNFTETSDNYTNRPYNGYLYAEDIIKKCNNRWNINFELRHMPDPPVPALPKKVQLQLCGVFFHRNTKDYDLYVDEFPPLSFVENSGEVINIFITKKSGGGAATGIGSTHERIRIGTAYSNYIMSVDSNSTWYMYPNLYNHELGHILGLPHAIQSCCSGKLCKDCDDRIADTPDFWQLIEMDYLPCAWNHILGSNNMMDYNADNHALSPMQISRMHACIDGAKLYYRNCKYKTRSLDITHFTTNKAYIAKQVNIPLGRSIVVANNSALFINAEEFTIDGEFEVRYGSIFNVDIVPSCD